MDQVTYLTAQAARFRELAKFDKDLNIRRQLFALAKQCEEIAAAIAEGPSYKKRP
jgi:hypothetical protein